MKKWEKEIVQKQISDEQKVIWRMRDSYKLAMKDVKERIAVLQNREQTQSVIYQLKYQQELQKQLETVYAKMSSEWYTNIDDYLKGCYEDGFYSTMYSLHNQGIPIILPFNQEEAAQMAAQSDYEGIKLSEKLYTDSVEMARISRQEMTRGLATNASYADIARTVEKRGEAGFYNAMRIVRTESHRIHNEVRLKTMMKAKEEGADVVKQWDSTVDKRTRSHHVELDGQLRELDQPFKIPSTGATAMKPGGFGKAAEDINCRCEMLQRARWALDKSEIDKCVGDLSNATDEQLQAWADKLGVSKDELIKASNGVIEPDGTINHSIKAKNYNDFKKKYKTKEADQTAKYQAQLDILEQEKDEIAKKYLQAGINNGAFSPDTTLEDVKEYIELVFPNLFDKAKNSTGWTAYAENLSKQDAIKQKMYAAKAKAAKKTPASTGISADAFSDARKKAAKNFSSGESADKYHRPILDKRWDGYSDREKYSIWEYTRNSNPMNKSLSGYHDSWDRHDFKGLGNTQWEHEDSWRSLGSNFSKFGKNGKVTYHRAITDLTKAIDKSEFLDECFLVRGSDNSGFAGLMESIMPFDDAKRMLDKGDIKSLKQVLEGNVVKNHAFTSTGIASGTGFSGKVSYKIYAPKGTKGVYAEPQSYFGNTVGTNEKLYKTGQRYYSVGGEAEVILQRGTSFRVTKIDYSFGNYTVEMEIVDQPNYFKYGDEETFNNGATRHKD